MKYNKEKREIISDKEISELDKFVLEFITILEKHIDYVIISGYISILLGRARATEDVDVFIKKISLEKFSEFYEDVKRAGFWCLNAEKTKEVFSYIEDGLAIRFAKQGQAIPNFEVKFPKRQIDEGTFEDFITVILSQGKIKISSLERQIAFKRYYLKSDKDIEDAVHIEELFKEDIDYDKINKLKQIVETIED
ncbi:MAG: hypothetical protein KKF56_02890 [Nanoarchaeota archaeon]|nr:hypothetical protein [Nanoarchaeota archaeon]